MKKASKFLVMGFAAIVLLASAQISQAFDTKFKYIIPSMKTEQDAQKVVKMIKETNGVKEVDLFLADNTVVFLFDDEELEDEKMELRIPLKRAGYRVDRYDILLETRR